MRSRLVAALVVLAAGAGLATEARAQGITPTKLTPATATKGTQYTTMVGTTDLLSLTSYSFSVTAGSLPPGVTLANVGTSPNKAATISGVPQSTGTFNFTVTMTWSGGSGTQSYTLVVNAPTVPLSVDAATLPVGAVGEDYAATITASGGTPPYGFLVTAGSLPQGLLLHPTTGAISGSPSQAGTTSFTVTATDAALATASRGFSIVVTAGLDLAASGPSAWPQGKPGYVLTFAATGASGAVTFDPPTGIPAGLAASAQGTVLTVSGTPSDEGSSRISVTARDDAGESATAEFDLAVGPPISLDAADLPLAVLGEAYSFDLPLYGGTAPIASRVVAGSLPAGFDLDGVRIAGTSTASGEYAFTVEVEDAVGLRASQGYSLLIARRVGMKAGLPPTSIPGGGTAAFVLDALEGTCVTAKIAVKHGMQDLTWLARMADGTPLDATPYARPGKKKLLLKKLPVPATGRLLLVLGNTGAPALDLSGKVSGKASKGFRDTVSWGPTSGETDYRFAALRGAKLTVSATARGRSVPAVELVALLGPDGIPVDTAPYLKTSKGGFKLAGLVTSSGGDFVLRLRPAATGAEQGILSVKAKIRSPKVYDYHHTE